MGEDSNIGIETFARGDALVMLVEGEVDLWTVHRFAEALSSAHASGAPSIVVDLDRVRFMDSSGLHVLIQCAVSEAMRHRLTVTRGSPQVRRLFEISGVGRWLRFAPPPELGVIQARGSTTRAPRSESRSGASRR
ncbi:MAG: STAS domain-containing protein [Solirubrobacterales bacterium]|nr:STAS domain-containing protein [Solirubrobacterales bacterium]